MMVGRLEHPCKFRYTVYRDGKMLRQVRYSPRDLYGAPRSLEYAFIWPESDFRHIVALMPETHLCGRYSLACYHVLNTFDAAEVFVRTMLSVGGTGRSA